MNPINAYLAEDFDPAKRIQLLVEKVADYAIYMLSPEGTVSTWNAGARRFKGYKDEEIIGQHFSRFYTEEDRMAGVPAQVLATAINEGKFEAEGWRVRKDGSRFWAHVVIDPIFDDFGTLVGFAKITRDITDRQKAKEALHESEEHFRLLVQSVIDYAIYMLSPSGEITNWNTGAQRIKGYSASEVVGTHFSRFYIEADRARGLPGLGLETARSTGRFETEGWRLRKDGTKFYASVVIDAIHNDANELIGFAKITRDISQRLLLEETRLELDHAQRLESIGKLTGGVAHDFNNILQIIGGNLQLLTAAIQGNDAAERHARTALNAVERGAKLSSHLLAFARRQPLKPLVINMGRTVRDMEDLLSRALGEAIEIKTVVADDLWNTMVDPHQLENVIINLAINARDAMPDGGKLTIEVANAMLDDTDVSATIDVPAGQYVQFAISDTGAGMAKEILERAVEPFFTTKPEGQGTGLGLSMAFGFVKQSGGHFQIYSEPGHGTAIKMYFPRSFENEEILSSVAAPNITGGTETILVVEDDLAVQQTVVEMLTSLGYKVFKANDATSALAVLKSGVHCDLLFTDVVMPGPLKSTELAHQAKTLLPSLEVLYTSGYTQSAIDHDGRLDPGVRLLSKPYRREDLALKIHQILMTREVQVPIQTARATTAEPKGDPQLISRRILVVEDNLDAQQMACELLQLLGHGAHGVSSAEEALKILAVQRFDILFTDYELPGMDGVTLARKAKLDYPQLAIVFMSGYGHIASKTSDFEATILTKPFDLAALQKAIK